MGGLIAGLALPFLVAVRRMHQAADMILGQEVEPGVCTVPSVARLEAAPKPEATV
jgi:hypothetical protein